MGSFNSQIGERKTGNLGLENKKSFGNKTRVSDEAADWSVYSRPG